MIGTSLSHYRITEKLCQDGMGEVYRAEDATLERQVAANVPLGLFSGEIEMSI
jgi:serine/threonine protein kinase